MKRVYFSKSIYNTIRDNVKKYRKQKGLTSADLATAIGITDEYMRRLESEKANCSFSFETFYKISVALDVTMDDLIKKN